MAKTAVDGPAATDRGLAAACKWAVALTDPSRVALILALRGGEMCVSELAARVGIEVVNTSHHLGVLRGLGVCESRKNGRAVMYSLANADYNASKETLTLRHSSGMTVTLPVEYPAA